MTKTGNKGTFLKFAKGLENSGKFSIFFIECFSSNFLISNSYTITTPIYKG